MAELFAGAGCLAKVFGEAGANVAAADVCCGPGMDICVQWVWELLSVVISLLRCVHVD